MRRVVVTGLGAITPLGVGIRRTWSRLLAGDSGITSVASREPQARWRELTCTVAGVVARGKAEGHWHADDWLTAAEQRRTSTFTQYALAASDMALEDAGWRATRQEDQEATGVCLGSGIGNLDEIYETSLAHRDDGYKKVSPLFVPKILTNMAAGHIAMKHGFQGPNHAATTACTTGAHSIGDASRFIALGDADVMVAGGSESCIHPLTFAGFGRARSLATGYNDDPRGSCRPFDAGRGGFVVAEGAAVCVLEELEHARARGARIYAEVRGYGCSGDAHHMTAPREDGNGAYLAMRRALRNAGARPAQVDYINAHATGTQVGDAAEAAAIRRLMLGDEGVASEAQVTVSSTKGAIGHLLGAAGAIEALFAILAVHEGIVPATLNLEKPDVGFDFNFVPLQAQEKEVKLAVTNSFGFGGTNSSLASFAQSRIEGKKSRHRTSRPARHRTSLSPRHIHSPRDDNGLRELQDTGADARPGRHARGRRQGTCADHVEPDDLRFAPRERLPPYDDDGGAGAVLQQHGRTPDPGHGRLPGRVVPRPGGVGAAVQGVLQGGRLPHHRGAAQERRRGEVRGRRGAGQPRGQGQRLAQDLQAPAQLQHVVARHDAAPVPPQRAAADARPRLVPQLAAAAGGPLLLRVRKEDAPGPQHHVERAAAALPQGHLRAVARPAARLRRGPHQGRRHPRQRRLAQPVQGHPGRRPPRPAGHRRLDALQPGVARDHLRPDLPPARAGDTGEARRGLLDEAGGALQAGRGGGPRRGELDAGEGVCDDLSCWNCTMSGASVGQGQGAGCMGESCVSIPHHIIREGGYML